MSYPCRPSGIDVVFYVDGPIALWNAEPAARPASHPIANVFCLNQ